MMFNKQCSCKCYLINKLLEILNCNKNKNNKEVQTIDVVVL